MFDLYLKSNILCVFLTGLFKCRKKKRKIFTPCIPFLKKWKGLVLLCYPVFFFFWFVGVFFAEWLFVLWCDDVSLNAKWSPISYSSCALTWSLHAKCSQCSHHLLWSSRSASSLTACPSVSKAISLFEWFRVERRKWYQIGINYDKMEIWINLDVRKSERTSMHGYRKAIKHCDCLDMTHYS